MNPALLQRQRVVHMPINHGLFEADHPHLCCPVCGFRNVHLATIDVDQGHVRVSATDDEARIGRSERHCHHRGSAVTLAFRCEAGHWFQYEFQFRKGNTFIELSTATHGNHDHAPELWRS